MKYAVLDFETTGDQPGKDEIIQVGLVIIDDNIITQTYTSFIKPIGIIPPFIQKLTGITNELVATAPQLDDVIVTMVPLLSDAVLVGHNISFDLKFLQRALMDCGYSTYQGRVLDTMDWVRVLFPTLMSYQLSYVTSIMNIPHDQPHHAAFDARATAMIWLQCVEKLSHLPLIILQRLCYLFSQPHSNSTDIAWFLEFIKQKRETEPDFFQIPTQTTYRQLVLNVDDWGLEDSKGLNGVTEKSNLQPFESFTDDVIHEMKQSLPKYEERVSQIRMMQEVYQALENNQHLIIEAGTGTGKSLGYLIPAIYTARKNNEKIMISTHTINLQDQLQSKELPMLQNVTPVPFRSAVLKGRSHYLCLRKFENKVNLQEFLNEREDRFIAAQFLIWLSETVTGNEEELNLGQSGNDFWKHVASDADSCLNRSCPWFRKCFYHRARNNASEADIVVTNHSLLFTDALAEHRVLPSYERLIVDEAHHFEDVAIQHFGVEISYFSMVSPLMKLFKDSQTGQLPLLNRLLQGNVSISSESWVEHFFTLYSKIVKAKEAWDELFEIIFTGLIAQRHKLTMDSNTISIRIKRDQPPTHWDQYTIVEDNVYTLVTEILKILDTMISELKEHNDDYNFESILTDLNGTLKDVQETRDKLRHIIKLSEPNTVYWIEANMTARLKSIKLFAAPIDVSQMMQNYFWNRKEAVILTSATLTVEKSFQHVLNQMGLHHQDDVVQSDGKVRSIQLQSPFRYHDQALVLIPQDFPKVKGAHTETIFVERLVDSLCKAAVITGGRMLVLFTSYKMLKETHTLLKEALRPLGISILGQGVESSNRSKLTRLFMQTKHAVLLGTSSFWEGVDIPGDALTCLAIVRLPFQPPNHPIVEAKSEFLRAKHQNPFVTLSVPQAVIRFKQGFGRLVRTSSDRGIVIIYDTRVVETSYGKHFLQSLPDPRIEFLKVEDIPSRMQQWLTDTTEARGE
jgi:ATP-dependent DNA helicase DinG